MIKAERRRGKKMSSVEFFLFFSHFGARACTTKKTSLGALP